MSAHNSDNIQDLYEGDQSKLYSGVLVEHHDAKSPESKKQVKKIWRVFWILLIITIVEVSFGLLFSYSMNRGLLNAIFLGLTIVKAAWIVYIFMHLGDEVKSFKLLVLLPLLLFIWFIIAFLADGGFWLHMNNTFR